MAVQQVFTEDDLILLLSEAEDEVPMQLFAQSLLDAACCKRDENTQQSEVYLRLPIYPNSSSWDSGAAWLRRKRDIDLGGSFVDAREVSARNITIKDQHRLFCAENAYAGHNGRRSPESVHRQNHTGGAFLPIPEDLQDQDSSNQRFLRTIPEDQVPSYEHFLRTIPENQDPSNEVCP